jgi:hypothetical protein
MQEHDRFGLAIVAAEAMYHLWELENQQEEVDLDEMMRRLKDLSAFSLTHAEIMDQREGVELLALAMFFGATSNPRFHPNQERLSLLSEQTIAYQGRAEIIEQEIAKRKSQKRKLPAEDPQPRLL